jgi:hypothetical protein
MVSGALLFYKRNLAVVEHHHLSNYNRSQSRYLAGKNSGFAIDGYRSRFGNGGSPAPDQF